MHNPFAFVDRTIIKEKQKPQERLRLCSSVYPQVRLSYNEQSNLISKELEIIRKMHLELPNIKHLN